MSKVKAALLFALATLAYAQPATLTTLYNFTGENGDGSGPYAGVTIGANGALYGTTSFGGAFNTGTVFALSPPVIPGNPWTETMLHSFAGGNDGAYPYAGVIAGASGELYGTTNFGGSSGMGIVYELTPPAIAAAPWTETVLYSFTGADGAYPYASLALAADGTLYGTTEFGGASSYGTVFALTQPAASSAWTETVLHSFTGGSDGGSPYASLVIAANGTLYGTANIGGTSQKGTVFKLTPPIAGGAWSLKVLHSFKGGSDGGFPYAGLSLDANGVIYGTTAGSVNAGTGTAFKLTPPASTGAWAETILHSFTGKTDGGTPHASLAFGSGGTLLGTTFGGGTGKRFNGNGVIYELTPPAGSATWTETVLYEFHGTDGGEPNAPLTPDATGVLYGTTLGGGTAGQGTVFLLTR
jgi:uncharacterized repeat protein (TIGR03803 family)